MRKAVACPTFAAHCVAFAKASGYSPDYSAQHAASIHWEARNEVENGKDQIGQSYV
jgi:hypothetical protein